MILNKEQYLKLKHRHNLDLFLLDRFIGFEDYDHNLRKYYFRDKDFLYLFKKIKDDEQMIKLKNMLEKIVDSKIKLGLWKEE